MSTARFTIILIVVGILLGAPLTIMTLHTTSGFGRIESSVNRVADKVDRLDERVDRLATEMAEITGALKAKGIIAKR